MIEADIPVLKVRDWLGHRSLQSTLVYTQVSDKAILLEWIRNLKNSDAEALLIWLSNTDLPELELLSHIVITHPEIQIGKTSV